MIDFERWSFYFAAIASLRFHPRNIRSLRMCEAEYAELSFAAEVADEMLRLAKLREKKYAVR